MLDVMTSSLVMLIALHLANLFAKTKVFKDTQPLNTTMLKVSTTTMVVDLTTISRNTLKTTWSKSVCLMINPAALKRKLSTSKSKKQNLLKVVPNRWPVWRK